MPGGERAMSVSTQQIQTVLRTYNKQLRLSGLNRKDKNVPHRCLEDTAARGPAHRKRHLSKQHGKRKTAPNRH